MGYDCKEGKQHNEKQDVINQEDTANCKQMCIKYLQHVLTRKAQMANDVSQICAPFPSELKEWKGMGKAKEVKKFLGLAHFVS